MIYLNICTALCFVWLTTSQPGECLRSRQVLFRRTEKKYLANHLIETQQADSEFECGIHCVADKSCGSVNYKTSGIGKGRCELKNKTTRAVPEEDTHNPEFVHLAIITPRPGQIKPVLKTTKKPTPQQTTEKSTPQQPTEKPTSQQTTEKPTPQQPTEIPTPQKTTEKPTAQLPPEKLSSCKELLLKNRALESGEYTLKNTISLEEYKVYCHMTDIPGCGSGGWTLAMKMDGSKQEFKYHSSYWSNTETYAVEDGLEGLTEKQTKLASYWNTSFHKICLGMKVNGVTKWIMINYQASSLFNVIADGVFKPTAAGRNAWKSLIADSALQYNCNKEGFNLHAEVVVLWVILTNARVRIGLFGNNEHDCNSVDSYIGLGASFTSCFATYAYITCGNVALCKDGSHYHEDKWTPAFGYILVQ